MINWKIEKRNIEELQGYDKNPRKFTEKGLKDLKKSLQNCGDANIITINADNTVLGGHARLTVMKQLGYKEVDVKVPDELLNEKQVQEVVVRLNANTAGEWDLDKLQADFNVDELNEWGLDIEFTELEEEKEIVEDEVPEEVETRAKRGDIWQLGNHRLMCGDSTSITDVEKLMNGRKADMVFTDPPYNVAIGDKNKALQTFQKAERITENIKNDVFKTDKECGEKLWLPAFTNMLISSNDNCSIYVTMPQGGTHMMMMMMMSEAGWQVKHELIWVKNSPTFSMGRLDYDYQHEPICFGWNKAHKKIGKGKFTKSIWQIDKPKKCDIHPTMKPIELIENALLNSSELNDNILDLFGGSGSTLIACEQLNRKCFIMELDEHYCDVIIQRWENLTGQKAVLIE